jgi:hypothetical protein
MEGLQIWDRTRAAEVKGVLANADVASGVPLTLRNVGEFVLDHRALSQRQASGGASELLGSRSGSAADHPVARTSNVPRPSVDASVVGPPV